MSKRKNSETAIPPERKLLDKVEAATILGVSPRTIYDWGEKGFISRVKVGPLLVKYKREEIEGIVEHGLEIAEDFGEDG